MRGTGPPVPTGPCAQPSASAHSSCPAVCSAWQNMRIVVLRRWAVGVRGIVTHTRDGEPVGVSPLGVARAGGRRWEPAPKQQEHRWVFTGDGESVSERW